MTRQPEHDDDDPHAITDDEAVIPTTAIARLWRRLRKLEETVAALDQARRLPGRHRAQATTSCDLKPDPAAARTAAEFMAALRHYKAWSGDPTWRAIAARAGQKRVSSTLCSAIHRDELPTADVVTAFITGCGGSEDDLQAFTSAWQRIRAVNGTTEDPGLLLPPVPGVAPRAG